MGVGVSPVDEALVPKLEPGWRCHENEFVLRSAGMGPSMSDPWGSGVDGSMVVEGVEEAVKRMSSTYGQTEMNALTERVQEQLETGSTGLSAADVANCRVLCGIAPEVVPVLYFLGDHSWPSPRVRPRRRGLLDRFITPSTPAPRFKVFLRRYDLGTLQTEWRLEAAGPVEFFDWDDSGRITGNYGYRYPVYTVRPVFDEVRVLPAGSSAVSFASEDGRSLIHSGFAINCRPLQDSRGYCTTIDARIDAPVYIRSNSTMDLVKGLKDVVGRPRIEEGRPGISPTNAYFDLMEHINREEYFRSWGYNEYVTPGWTPETLMAVFYYPAVRALWVPNSR
jgi:hypothetical protein